ncbi:2-hydroxychromene-2-carboxylate isomerase [Pollutimonas thiosulfatoxidans]|uniref:2-hydroxychromene-2-carboxylate isomerase n=1 Tax=Pollutimonas thiosulfatoxidans TaxID=2028345 RepID=A0A410GFL2_9BURK|nr:2-hydroxychromene-2-carboxylate isomerase [Pollutimonas thiosulfatoxidans]MBF6615804.1 2-hydroxychromene-2-carboxylate isomerase [Candidimonas sp.]QAA95097.1 2-hydroxychromene-2-carboxylate isomerase [Pollutimonas thiosulfatoxidans]
MKTIRYYLVPKSPWTYLGHERLLELARKHGAAIEPRPFGLTQAVFPISGGLPLNERPVQRQAYRLVELQRWSDYLGLPLTLHPKHFPVDDLAASKMIISVAQAHGNDSALRLAGAMLRAVWAEERDIADTDTLIQLANESGLNGDAVYAAHENGAPLLERYTQEAIDLKVFGAPWYEYNGESFWGQDRLDFLDRALAAPAR